MRISLNWLRELVDISMTPEALAEKLTMAGFEVEDIEDRRTWADGVVVGKVLTREQHPNADRLSLCTVDIGAESPSQIVCGAANVRADIFVAVATLGTYLPNVDLKIKPAKLRGVESKGMICSMSELGLTKESEGIHIFDESVTGELKPGMDVRPLLGLDDAILDLTSTANRADALSMVGIAREVAALTGGTLRLPEPAAPQVEEKRSLSISIQDPQACPTYIGTIIENVKIAPSPLWLQRRLLAAGVRSINNIVDVTNYIMLEWGQPLHAFDLDSLIKVAGTDRIEMGVRFARSGESVKTLDGQDRKLQEQALLITVNDKPTMLAGVFGGEETEVSDSTQNVLLEAAIFDSAAIRKSARSQGLRTEASARYERGVNLAGLETASRRAIELMLEVAGGTVTAQNTIDHRPNTLTRTIELRLERVREVLGLTESDENFGELQVRDVERTLSALGCELKSNGADTWIVTVPPYRYRDLEREIDLIEEVARLYGYNNFRDTLPAETELGYLSIEQVIKRKVREAFRAGGLTELIHYSLGKPGEERQIVLANPLFTEYSALRTDLVNGLIEAFQYNLEQGNGALNGFEIGHIFAQEEELVESEAIGGILGGDPTGGKWIRGGKDQPMSWFEAKGVLDSVFDRIGLTVEYQPDRQDKRLHPGRTASLWVKGDRLGTFGQLHPQLRQERGLPDEVYTFQLDLEVIIRHLETDEALVPVFKAFSTYPASDRDIAFYAARDVAVSDLERTIVKAGGKLLESVELFDEYKGDRVPQGQRSLAFRLVYRADDRTLKDEDVDPVHQRVREALTEKFRVDLRS
ncbi:phenylalanine--tRNA ligase subunit beta [Leptolyngbya sp. NIES-2104]|uniref:phenylalanine--tRNA ligase subunit beta n=1 Tax=Leptolyngbya sp. NIES-2104 TaxID=1552121 RepID=UPI0006EC533E|nr:phenylalanine--tRNA ligase subunit beta [Leptolyngbya sp. NIES-2104]GAP98902.1 phenylalanyl-tRNA synthetase beta chain [Leptolyngbya sp. NIES-2104]